MFISRDEELRALLPQLREHRAVAIDTEFERERTYYPKLQLIQLGVPGTLAAIDPLSVDDLSPVWDLLADPAVTKITHAGRQDAEIFYQRLGAPPRNIYDTQIAAALVGMGEQIGYANLVSRILRVKLKKTERVTDWSRRPLSDAQLEYALDDVRHLHALHEHLESELVARGRQRWLQQEIAFYEEESFYNTDPDRLWMRVSGWRTLNRRGLGILRELALWREETAIRRDIPRGRVTPDDVLVDIALRRPESPGDLRPLRRLHPREIERSGRPIVAAVAKGMQVPEEDLPTPPRTDRDDPELNLVADLMGVVLKKRAREENIATSYLATQKELGRVVSWLADPDDMRPDLLRGWRYELVGKDLEALWEGRSRLSVHPKDLRVVLENHGD